MGCPPRAGALSRADYDAYIHSPEWRAKRQAYMDSKLPKHCRSCRKPHERGFHLHHRTYKNLGVERLMDLVMLCPQCHAGIHDLQRRTGWDLWKATKRFVRYQRTAARGD